MTAPLALGLLGLAACAGGGGDSESTLEPTTGGDTETTETTGTPAPVDCGEYLALAGACFEIERYPLFTSLGIVIPGDFNGDGVRDYFVDDASLAGDYGILREDASGALVYHFHSRMEDYFGDEAMVYRATALDYDRDGRTDLFVFAQIQGWSGHVWRVYDSGLLLHAQPGFHFREEGRLRWYYDPMYPEIDIERFDGTFADIDGDGLTELFFAHSPFIAHLYTLDPDANPHNHLTHRQKLDLLPLGLEKNVATIAADLDGDGGDELIVADGLGRVWTYGLRQLSGELELIASSDTPLLPPMAGTFLAHDLDGDGELDLIGASTSWWLGELTPGEFAIARGLGDGRFEPLHAWTTAVGPSQTASPMGSQLPYVHLVLLDLDDSGYPALIYALPEEKTLVVHPQVGRDPTAPPVVLALDYTPIGVFLDPQENGRVDLLVSFDRDTKGTDDRSDDEGPFLDRYRLRD